MAGIHDHTNPGTCIPCSIKHLGAAMIHLGEAMASTDSKRLKRRLLEVTFDLNEAESTHLADRYPELAKEIREMRKKVEEAALGAAAEPGVTRDDIERMIDRLLEYREKEEEGVICPTCSRVSMDFPDLGNMDGSSIRTPEGQRAVMKLMEYESKKYGVPVPKVVFEENKEHCEATSCSIMDDRRPAETTKIYLNPGQPNFSLRTPLHEFGHYFFTIVHPGGKAVKRDGSPSCPVGFECDGGSEDEADKFAFMEMESLPGAQRINSDLGGKEGSMQETVLRQEPSNVFAQVDSIYNGLAGVLKITPQEANEAYTPEILGTAVETGLDIVATPLGGLILNEVLGLIYMGVGSLSNSIGSRDKVFLNEMAAHHVTRVINAANPGALAALSGGAKGMGDAVARGRGMDALYQVVKKPEEIQSGFKSALSNIQAALGPLARSGGGDRSDHAATTEQRGSSGGVPPFQ